MNALYAVVGSVQRLVRRMKCRLGIHWWLYDSPCGYQGRVCRYCDRRERYVLVDFGRSKTWMPAYKSPNATPSATTKENK